ncbi:MAG: type III-B CRISPR module RAMP protein Cmr4, partial [Anaerolineae bacterium]|nr:type III-B CRISPR module RAMP protein Cmr4 [Anaerolineae bacterium]
ILFFPVHSMVGPVWVTAASALAAANLPVTQMASTEKIRTAPRLVKKTNRRWGLNLGWLFLDIESEDLNVAVPAGLEALQNRLVLLPEDLFALVVNSNLEVRTSVSIDPATGAAEEGALFTYEALPRGTVLQFPITSHNPQHFVFPALNAAGKVEPTPFPENRTTAWVQTQVEKGLGLMEYLGVGGMNTRGFGRFKVLNLNTEGGK